MGWRASWNGLRRLVGATGRGKREIKSPAAQAAGRTPPVLSSDYLAGLLPADALAEARIVAVANSTGEIAASVPASEKLDGQLITNVLSPSFITEAPVNSGEMVPLSALMKVQSSFGPERAMRYNGFLSAEIKCGCGLIEE